MKKWNSPAIAELSLDATESGLFCLDFETFILFNDNLKKCPTPTDNIAVDTPTAADTSTPSAEDDVTDQLS